MNREEYDKALYLAHHGIKGQKWGVRRFQNDDGSYKSGAEGRYDPESEGGTKSKRQIRKEERAAKQNATYTYKKASVNEDGSLRASNGMKVAKSRNLYSKFVGKLATSDLGRIAIDKKIPGVHDTPQMRDQMRKERAALKERDAHDKDLRKGTGDKYLKRAEYQNNLDNATEMVKKNATTWQRLTTSDKTFRNAGKILVNGNKNVKQSIRAAKTANAIGVGVSLLTAIGYAAWAKKRGLAG